MLLLVVEVRKMWNASVMRSGEEIGTGHVLRLGSGLGLLEINPFRLEQPHTPDHYKFDGE
jgi:hypothetical protein